MDLVIQSLKKKKKILALGYIKGSLWMYLVDVL